MTEHPPHDPALTRRDFLQDTGKAGLGMAVGAAALGGQNERVPPSPAPLAVQNTAPIPQRTLGKSGAKVSILGVGGHHLGDIKDLTDAVSLVHEALDAGITFFDNCWEYHNGKSEAWLGTALKGRRDQAFVMTKVCTHGREGRLGLQMLGESLRRLQTDHLDLWQIHAVSYDSDPDLAYARDGILDAMEKAKKQGKVRFVGFTGHRDPDFHLRMLAGGFPFDTVQMPLNPFDANFYSFEKQVLPEAQKRGVSVLGMKPLGGTADAIKKNVLTAEEMLRYAMSLPVLTTICGMDSLDVLRKNIAVARGFQPMSAGEMDALRQRCVAPAADGRFELYKVSLRYDNPITRMSHGFPADDKQRETKDLFEKRIGLPGALDTHGIKP
jgi:predicted aldo/keto reductase-like oxidoreductase